jgi:hypothetical protein
MRSINIMRAINATDDGNRSAETDAAKALLRSGHGALIAFDLSIQRPRELLLGVSVYRGKFS